MTLNKHAKDFLFLFIKLVAFALVLGTLTRIVLMFNPQTVSSFSFLQVVKIFTVGLVNDFAVAVIGVAVIFLNLMCVTERKYSSVSKYIILSVLIVAVVYLRFFAFSLREFNQNIIDLICLVLIYKIISFSIRAFIPKARENYSRVIFILTVVVFVAVAYINCLGEYLFWDEFGVRYNFIAVDYLVYTNEVIGNIIESYPIVSMFCVIALLVFGSTYFLIRKGANSIPLPRIKERNKAIFFASYAVLVVLAFFGLSAMEKLENNANVYVNELQANGIFKFYRAFGANELEYNRFYLTIDKQQAVKLINSEYSTFLDNNIQQIQDSQKEIHKNIVLVTIESMGAEYFEHFGSKRNITPFLDSLADKSLCLNNLYATGTRTVRGLEAVTLCIPPSAGASIIKRQGQKIFFSTAQVLKNRGYSVQFLYGGDSYFDNMYAFFSHNGYEIFDQKSMSEKQKTFETVWGVCDEDLFNKAIDVFDKDSQSGKPFFAHIMTVSNHRPFLYPEGKIDISPKKKDRAGGVKYTDYAIRQFIKKAQQKPWFANTVFIFTADHCGSTSGASSILIDNYHIPCLIYSPSFISAKQSDILCSQIDIMPTVFSLLHFSYTSEFYGQNIFSNTYKPRAFMATYQNLGFLSEGILTVLSPAKKVEQFVIQPPKDFLHKQSVSKSTNIALLKQTIANYQTLTYRHSK
jgi:Phosphoglycerol transferase and related proteins, alkaline phosphatase superfamily